MIDKAKLTQQAISQWASADVLEQGKQLFASGAVQGVQRSGEILGGSLKIGAARIVTRLRLGEGKPIVDCRCAVAQHKGVCAHAVAVALEWLRKNPSEDADTAKENAFFSAEHAPTLLQIERWIDPKVLKQAVSLVKAGQVRNVEFLYPNGSAEIHEQWTTRKTTFKMLPNGRLEGTCTCLPTWNRGRLCEHLAATLLAVMQIYGSEERRAQYAAERAKMARMATAKGLIKRDVGGVSAMVRLFLPSMPLLKQFFYQDKIKIAVRIYINEKPFKPQDLPPRAYAFSPADETLLDVLEDIAEGFFTDEMIVSAADLLALLRCAEHSWVGFAASRQRIRIDAQPIALSLHIRALPEEDALEVSLVVPNGGDLLARGVQGFVVNETHFTPLARTLPLPYQALYTSPIRIPHSAIGQFYRAELPQLTAAVPLDEESVTFDLFTSTPGTPRFCLELEGTEISLLGRLYAHYGDTRVTVGSQEEVSQTDPDDFYHCYVRNREAERRALERTSEMGFCGREGQRLGVIDGNRAIYNLLGEHLPALRRAGWRVELFGPIRTTFEQAEMIVPVVSVTSASDGRTFEVTTAYDAPTFGVTFEAKDIERALAHGNAYIEKEGKRAFIDREAIHTLRETLASCNARAGRTPGSSQIDTVYAPYIEAALAGLDGIDFEAQPDWRKRAAQQNREQMPEAIALGEPLEGTLRPYQKEGVYWLRFLETCGFCGILADEMGLGKTLQTLTWLQLPRVRDDAARVPALIICPTSLVENWRREAEKFVPWLKCVVLSGADRAKNFAEVPKADLVITSYALIRRDTSFHTQCRYGVVVLDEAQAIKNQRTQNAHAVKQLRADTRLVLSGTPIENGVADLWSIMDFLMPNYLGRYDDFKVRYEDAVAMGGKTAEHAQEQLRKKLHPFLLRRVKKDVAPDLPDKIRSVMYCELSMAQRKAYDRIRDQVRSRMRNLVKEKGFERSRFEVLADLMRLRQICCDVRLLANNNIPMDHETSTSAKLDALLELLEEARSGGHRMLVFSQFTSMLKRIGERLTLAGIRFCYLDGSTKNRLEICSQFNQDTGITVFLISLKAGGTGLNLTGADMVVHFDPWWNPAAEEQATDRAHRIGQKKTVQVIKMIAQDTIEEKVLELQQKKRTLIDATVNMSDDTIVSTLTLAEIEDLLT